MKYKIWIGLIILFFLLSGCTYRDELISSGKDTFRKGDLDKAEEIFAELTQFSPRYHAGYLYLGFINLYQDKINEAIKYFEKSLVLNDQPDLEYLGLGQAYLAMSKYDLAREYLEKARMVEQYPVTEYLLGFIYLYAGESEKAQEKLHTASKSYPERGEIWAALGKVLLENHKILDAVQAYQMAYIYGIKTYDLYFGLAEAYYFLGNNRQAIAIIEQALAEPYLSDQEREELGMKLAQYNMN